MTAKFLRVDYVSRMKDTTYYMHKINANPFIQICSYSSIQKVANSTLEDMFTLCFYVCVITDARVKTGELQSKQCNVTMGISENSTQRYPEQPPHCPFRKLLPL